jgi:DNA-binding PadR family transcriptional regulator
MLGTLDAILIFLVGQKGQSGYDIRQLFQSTPLGTFSDSPGSIYPSLARLEARGLLSSAVVAGGRRRRGYKRTAEGEKALRSWLAAPIEPDDVRRRPSEIELRFVMIAEASGWSAAVRFLTLVEAAFAAQLEGLETFLAGPGAAMSRASRSTVDLGIRICRLRIKWCRDVRHGSRRR